MKKYVQWWEVKEYLYNLVDRLKKDQCFHLDECPGIFTFPRGGLMLATLLSYEIDKPIYQKTKIIFGNTLGTIINIFLTILYFILAKIQGGI